MSNSALRFWRSERQLNQLELAAASHIARWKIQLFENNLAVPSLEEQMTLSSVLGVPMSQLFPALNKCESKKSDPSEKKEQV